MRPATLLGLLLVPIVLAASACEDSNSALEPSSEEEARRADQLAALAAARWADGYLTMFNLANPSDLPEAYRYNRSGGRITVTRPAGSTGRYIATFTGLSTLLGTKSTVQVTGYGRDNAHCKPVTGVLVNDKVEVRCFNSATGVPAEAAFSLVVLRKTADRAFAFAHQPTAASYTPQAKGSWNPAGTMKVNRLGTGSYQVLFNKLGAQLSGVGGHVQVSAIGTGNAYCKLAEEWGGSPNLGVIVQCYTLAGQPVDAKFTVLFQRSAAHVAYVYANRPGTTSYEPDRFWSAHPTGGKISISRASTGLYYVDWVGADPEIIDMGNIQVTALGFHEYAQCKVEAYGSQIAGVRCFAPSGTLVDVAFTVLMGS